MPPRVTIGMPVYNAAALLPGALDSLLSQDFEDFVLITSDNASTDGTAAILAERAAQDRRIRTIRQPQNVGPQPNFGIVLGEATTPYFMWAAHDDLWETRFLRTLVGVLDDDEETVLATCDYDVHMHTTGERVPHASESIPRLTRGLSRADTVQRLLRLPQPTLMYGLFRTEVLRSTRALHRRQFDFSDLALLTEVGLLGGIQLVPEVLFHAGVVGDARKPYSLARRRLVGFKLNYGCYARHSLNTIARARGLSVPERARLAWELLRQVARLAHWHEYRTRRRPLGGC